MYPRIRASVSTVALTVTIKIVPLANFPKYHIHLYNRGAFNIYILYIHISTQYIRTNFCSKNILKDPKYISNDSRLIKI